MSPTALNGLSVLDLGQYLAGPLAALLLADQGAQGVRIDPPGGPSWDTPANAALLRGRQRRELDLKTPAGHGAAKELVAHADVLIENFRPGVMERLGLGREDCLSWNPRLIYCSMPGFGSDDPRAAEPGWEGVVLAAAGAYASGSREMLQGEWWPGTGPAFSPLLLGSVFGGLQAAVAITAALIARDRDGRGQWIEIPLHDAFFEALGARALSYERNAPAGTVLGAGFYRCADGGWVSLITVWHRHLLSFLEAAGVGSWITAGLVHFDRLTRDPVAAQELSRRLVALIATRTAMEWEELGQAAGVPIAALRRSQDWVASDHAVASGVLIEAQDATLGTVRVPGAAVNLSARTAESAEQELEDPPGAEHGSGPQPLTGLRVLDMTRVLAAPSASRLLAELGAEVIQADVDPADTRVGLRQPFFHEQANRGKRSVVVDLRTEEGRTRVEVLLGWADVLVTNFTLPAIRRMGLDERTVRTTAPHIVYTYLNAFGTSGPWADLRGYAEIANTVTGITERTLGDGPPSGVAPAIDLPRCPFTDYAAGVLGAFAALLGTYHRNRTGLATRVETSLVAAASYEQLPYLVDHVGKTWDEPRAPDLGWEPLQRLYRTADDWIFLGAPRQALPDVLEALDVELHAEADRTELEQALETALAARSSSDCAALLQGAGAGVHRVSTLDELFAPGGSADRRGLRLEQHSTEFGKVVQPGPTMRLSRTPMRPGFLPGPFGADGDAVLADVTSAGSRQ
jgi:crotonobetainyl-CoA:carnitine CoA-transferase CaiB-like acyl-CoA transferase